MPPITRSQAVQKDAKKKSLDYSEEKKHALNAYYLALETLCPGNKISCEEINAKHPPPITSDKVYRNSLIIQNIDKTWKGKDSTGKEYTGHFDTNNIMQRTYEAIQSKAGNCDQNAFVVFSYLIMRGTRNVYICQSNDVAHTFVIITYNQDKRIIICDPWANFCGIASLASEVPLAPWPANQLLSIAAREVFNEGGEKTDYQDCLYEAFTTTDVFGNIDGSKAFTYSLEEWNQRKGFAGCAKKVEAAIKAIEGKIDSMNQQETLEGAITEFVKNETYGAYQTIHGKRERKVSDSSNEIYSAMQHK